MEVNVATMTFFGTTEDFREESVGPSGLERIQDGALSAAACRHFAQGLERLNRGDARQAATCFELALGQAPDFADGHIGLGIAYALDGRIYPALDHLQKAAELEPENFYAHFKLGQFYFKLRIPQKGYAEISRALDCAAALEERKLVAQVLHEEKQREKNGVVRPWWSKPFSRRALYVGAGLVASLLVMLVLYLR